MNVSSLEHSANYSSTPSSENDPDNNSAVSTSDMGTRAEWVLSQPNTIISLVLASVAIISNVLSLLALTQVRSRLYAYSRLIASLSVADILIGKA